MTHRIAKALTLTFILLPLLASPAALAQANLPANAASTAHKTVADNVDPSVMAEVDRMKAEQEARSDESRNNFSAPSQGSAGIRLLAPPSTPVIVVVETEDGELIATEF